MERTVLNGSAPVCAAALAGLRVREVVPLKVFGPVVAGSSVPVAR